MQKLGAHMGKDLMKQLQQAQNDSNKLMKQLNSELSALAELINVSIDQLNEVTKCEVSNYELNKAIAEKLGIDIPKPKTKIELE